MSRGKNIAVAIMAFATIMLYAMPVMAADLSKSVEEIRVMGNKRASTKTILYYIHTKIGFPYSVTTTREDIRRIFKLGYFNDARLEILNKGAGLVLIYHVEEKPFINAIHFTGAREVPEKDMRIIINLRKGTYLQKNVIKSDIRRIKRKYQNKGFYFTKVKEILTDMGNNMVDITYHISEKKKIRIAGIRFIGNKNIDEADLRDGMKTKGMGYFSFWSDDGTFERENLKRDILSMEALYRERGYIKATIANPRVEIDREMGAIFISISITEGDRYFVGDVTAEGDFVHTSEEILETLRIKKGEPFNQSKFREDLFAVTDMYANRGYAYASPEPDTVEHEAAKTVDIHVKIDPGDKVYIGTINISGNEKTYDNVIRREMRLQEGELFNATKMRRSKQRINNTGFFKTVEISQKTGTKPGFMDLDIALEEKATGSISAGVGFSSVEQLSVNASIAESNLFGTGREMRLGIENSLIRQDYYLKFTERRLFDRDIRAGFELFSRQFNLFGYKKFSKGASTTIGRGIGEFAHASLTYKLETNEVRVDSANVVLSPYLASQNGTNLTSSILPAYVHDTRDDFLVTRTGHRIELHSQVAGGPLGGELDFWKAGTEMRQYIHLPFDFVLMGKATAEYGAGYNNKTLPIFENFFLGGARTLRGYQFTEVGPLDSFGNAIGGDSSLLFNVEVQYHFTNLVKGILFYDRGQVYGKEGNLRNTTSSRFDLGKMRHSVGFGLHFNLPGFPLALIWGFKLDQKPDETSMEFHFELGGAR